ncbi:bifunctional ADP-dependent NAD(P)H-hydrate dehydratase/NAD(P)H-hydrate epimerase [Brumimicrobium salinarum]|uniref:Bifunctional NAD(P)H-hydrate repair enzyme n=1 Tax=Brumimicrobium salinarum TaxID=2058658 RepID=A0A2I0R215_9FLAO|nr:NAD(P)H-hydrate dehydratase [Brumimicrobium salinarum]PKR80612.1 bifunctional ADP-dependent NAD(P)H-hydrate dehydratase/NAD(P)H-hydrate epimerase [Brumimicrobium salinarum]
MKLLNAQQIRELESITMERQNITSADLMQRTASKTYFWIKHNLGLKYAYTVVVGPGNNGGDGLVLAQFLTRNDYDVECVLLEVSDTYTPEYTYELEKLKRSDCKIKSVKTEADFEEVNLTGRIVIDAIFGIGLSRPAANMVASFIEKINTSLTQSVIAIDLPSGLYCDQLNSPDDTIVLADTTLTFHVPKPSFFFLEGGNSVGKIIVLDIRLDYAYANDIDSKYFYLTTELVGTSLKKRTIFTHKGNYGHANLIGGRKGMIGAAVLMTKAASFSGVGLITSTVPSVGLEILQQRVPVAMCETRYGEHQLEGEIEIDEKYTYGIGPGMGTSAASVQFLSNFLDKIDRPVVIDADAINCIAENPELLNKVPENSILTPHVKEFRGLAGDTTDSLKQLELLTSFSMKHKVYIVLKDARTIVCTPEGKCLFSLNGTPGMATGGTGDVLTGILTGLLAQGYTPEETAKVGLVLHGVAGELAAERLTEYAMTAETIIEEIGNAFKVLLNA